MTRHHMFLNMTIGRRLFLGFSVIFLLLVGISAITMNTTRHLASLTTDLYDHPFAVSNAARDIYISLLQMRLLMKDVTLVNTHDELARMMKELDVLEQHVFENFALIQERFLGERNDVDALIQTFTAWKSVRENIMALWQSGRQDDARASVNTGEGSRYFAKLEREMDALTDFAANKAASFLSNAQRQSEQTWIFTIVMSVVAAITSLLTITFLSRSITRPLHTVITIAEQVAEGNVHVNVPAHSRDELGQMLGSLQKMVQYIQEVSVIAENVAQQNLHVDITPKSERDVLNLSLQRMVTTFRSMIHDLEQAVHATERQNWIKDGLNQLNTALSGESLLSNVSMKALSFIARYVNAGHGVAYAYDAQRSILFLSGTFAFTDHDELAREFRLGEGIIGQVARERLPIILTNIPRRDAAITTGTVSDASWNTYTYPLLYDNELYGVMELATTTPLNDQRQNFLESANRVVATAVFSAMQREQLQQLHQARAE